MTLDSAQIRKLHKPKVNVTFEFEHCLMSSIAHYCQRCLAANPLGTDFCGRCGTRLMLVVEPNSLRFEAAESGVSTNEHLLERISATENRITRLAERLERSLELV